MESKEFLEAGDGVTKETQQSQPQIRRELDSMDDFEHLGHDSLHQKDNELTSTTVKNEVSELLGHNYSGDLQEIINKGVDSAEGAVNQLVDTAFSSGSHFDEDLQKKEKIVMDSNLIEKMEDFSTAHDEKEKMEKFFEDDNFGTKDLLPDFKNKDILSKSAVKTVTYDFMEAEKGIQDAKSQKIIDFETESPKHENLWKKEEPPKESFSSVENLLADDFRDVKEDFEQPMEPVKSKKDAPAMKPTPVTPLPSQEFKDASSEKISEKHQPKETKIKEVETAVPESKKLDIATPKEVIEAEVFFCKMGLGE
ncbi:hypothetical protein HHI36_009764 [Cryptolaemus montrouzieri]|uniref:Uncharacterized protein n=1 Tax=Cryptolaemus montrouzieri TaxID=559131 RepID=A0ABD2MGX7_9CUCU